MNRLKWLALILVPLGLVACGGGGTDEVAPEPAAPEPAPVAVEQGGETGQSGQAIARLVGATGTEIRGEVAFEPAPGGGVHISAFVSGLEGAGEHGFHIHEIGDCSAADFKSTGGHFNPEGAVHGGPDDGERHAGDLGNITIGENGSGELHAVSTLLSLDPNSPSSVVGRGVILHAGTDDLVSQPTGAAGGRIACGVIEAHNL